jgi:hypothetical protein
MAWARPALQMAESPGGVNAAVGAMIDARIGRCAEHIAALVGVLGSVPLLVVAALPLFKSTAEWQSTRYQANEPFEEFVVRFPAARYERSRDRTQGS